MARHLRPGDALIPATIHLVKRTGPVSYVIETGEYQLWKCQVDQLSMKTLADSKPVEG